MTWRAKAVATQLTLITTEQFFDKNITLNPGELAHVEVEANPVGSPTDDLIVSVYATLDDTSENWDDTARLTRTIDKGTDPNKVSFTVSSLYKCRIGVKRSGSTDIITSADMSYRKDGIINQW